LPFGLEWNTGLAGSKAAPEDIANAAKRIKSDAGLRDWYAPTGSAPWPLDIVLCQRSSAVWGRRAHSAYAITILSLGSGWLIVGIVMGLAAHLSLGAYLLKLFLPSQPAFLDTIDLARTHFRQSSDKHAVETAADSLWDAGIHNPAAVTADDCRDLQDQSYRLRRHGPQIAQWFYKLRRDSDEQAMRTAVGDLVSRLPAHSADGFDDHA
jgi:SMODS-associating 4TM effector domain